MIRMLLAAAAAFALVSAVPAFACPDCHDCPMHKDKVAAADKAEKKGAEKKDAEKDKKVAGCSCQGGDAKAGCKCGAGCHCAHCAGADKKAEKKS